MHAVHFYLLFMYLLLNALLIAYINGWKNRGKRWIFFLNTVLLICMGKFSKLILRRIHYILGWIEDKEENSAFKNSTNKKLFSIKCDKIESQHFIPSTNYWLFLRTTVWHKKRTISLRHKFFSNCVYGLFIVLHCYSWLNLLIKYIIIYDRWFCYVN